ncbi:MAG: alpha/beta hydrolase [Coriobacteriia bacterium]|nr:alpha/beta hydrolase [Coriobacteriia bacterium]
MLRRTRRRLAYGVTVLLALLLVGPLVVPVPALRDTVPARELADDGSRFTELNGIDVHFRDQGSGDLALVLLHGFGASTFTWREVAGPLAERGRVIAFDRPAFGLTERPLPGSWEVDDYPGGSPYSPEAQADMVVALLDRLGIERAVLVGHSAGGSIAMLTAVTYPDRVEALVLVDAAVYTQRGPPTWLYPLLNTPQARRLGPLVARRIGGAAGDRFLELAWHDPSGITPEIRAGYRAPLAVDDWDRALWELTVASSTQPRGDRAGEVACPTLVMTGDDDRVIPPEEAERLARAIPGAEFVAIEDCGHVPHEEQPHAFTNSVYRFLDTLPIRQAGCLSAP